MSTKQQYPELPDTIKVSKPSAARSRNVDRAVKEVDANVQGVHMLHRLLKRGHRRRTS